jgi:hypothetical protein
MLSLYQLWLIWDIKKSIMRKEVEYVSAGIQNSTTRSELGTAVFNECHKVGHLFSGKVTNMTW